MALGMNRLMCRLMAFLKMKQPSYVEVEKTESMRVEIRSRKARKLIEQTLKIADSPKLGKSYAF